MKKESNKNSESQSPDTLDSIENKIGKVDKILDKTKTVLKKHWGIILFILFCAFMYWAFNLPPVEPEESEGEQQVYSDTPYYDEGTVDTTYYEETPKE